jgi:hypothetical protein
VLGLEEVTSYFHYGIAESVGENPLSAMGYPTSRDFGKNETLDVRYIMGVVGCPDTFGRVKTISPNGEGGVDVRDEHGQVVSASVDWNFLQSGT